jgi:hypothetical protein
MEVHCLAKNSFNKQNICRTTQNSLNKVKTFDRTKNQTELKKLRNLEKDSNTANFSFFLC